MAVKSLLLHSLGLNSPQGILIQIFPTIYIISKFSLLLCGVFEINLLIFFYGK